MFANILQRRLLKQAGIDVINVHPGEVKTKVVSVASLEELAGAHTVLNSLLEYNPGLM